MSITLDGTSGITTPGLTNTGTETLINLTTTGNTILGDASTDTLNVGNGGLVKDASGNVGIGVTPSAWNTASYKAMQIGGTAALFGRGGEAVNLGSNVYVNSGASEVYITTGFSTLYNQQSGVHRWYNAPSGTAGNPITFTQAMTLDASGNLGIGTASPVQKLSVYGADANNNLALFTRSGGATLYFYGDAGANVGFFTGSNAAGAGFYANSTSNAAIVNTNGAERMRIDSSGNVGIGVTPSAWQSIFKGITIAGSYSSFIGRTDGFAQTTIQTNSYYNNSNQHIYNTTGFASRYSQQATGNHVWDIAPSGTAGNPVTFTQAMTLDASGNLLVGATSLLNQRKLYVAYNDTLNNGFAINETTGAAGAQLQLFASAGATCGSIVRVGATSAVIYNTTSDYRLKNNQQPLTGSGAFIDALKPKTWEWSADGSKGVGFVAHEFAEVSPSSVSGEKDATEVQEYEVSPAIPAVLDAEGVEVTPAVDAVMGERTVPKYQGMQASSSEVMANIVAEIQSLRIRSAALEAIITSLTARLEVLEAK